MKFLIGFHTVCIQGLLGFADCRTGNHAVDLKPPALRNADRATQRNESNGWRERSGFKWLVYLLRCGDGTLYTGITKDATRRTQQHNAGTASRYTRSRLPVALVYQESAPSQSLALKREATIKAMSRLDKESLIRQTG